jgi:hypothetical protein
LDYAEVSRCNCHEGGFKPRRRGDLDKQDVFAWKKRHGGRRVWAGCGLPETACKRLAIPFEWESTCDMDDWMVVRERRTAFARCSMLFGSSWRSSRSHLLETRTEGIDAFSSASARGLAWSAWWMMFGLTQDDRDVLVRVFVGDVVQGACGVDGGHARVCGPGDSVVSIDDHVLELALQHAH